MKYGEYNWIRLWLLGEDPRIVDRALLATSSQSKYLAFITNAISNARAQLRDDGYICLVLGDVDREEHSINLASRVAEECLGRTDLRVVGEVTDRLPTRHKVSRIWKESKGRATKTDRILVLAGPGASDTRRLERPHA